MNARLADGTTTGDLVLQQAEIIPQTQHFFDFSHGQSLLGHSVSPLARGEIPIGCPAPLSAPTQKAPIQKRQYQPRFQPASFNRGSDYSHPRNLYSHARNPYSHPPVIFIHIAPESVFTCPGIRNQEQMAVAAHDTLLARPQCVFARTRAFVLALARGRRSHNPFLANPRGVGSDSV